MSSRSPAPPSHRDNSFDAVRLVAAVTVVVAHAWPLTGFGQAPLVGGIKVFHLGVYVFFALSGYLVTTSWSRDPRLGPYLIRRASRIFPALIALVLLTVLVVGPLVSTLGPGEYFSSPMTWGYLQNLTLLATYDLPGVFTGHPIPVVNGALWTLGPEFTCYLGVLAIGLTVLAIGRMRRSRAADAAPSRAPALVFAALGIALGALALSPLELGGARPVVTAMVFFAGGAALASARLPRMPLLPAGVLLAGWVVAALLLPGLSIVWAWIALPYLVLAIGSRPIPVARAAGRFGDISYGMYLWGFPVQQVVIQLAPQLPLWVDIAVVLVVTAAIAAASWFLVERPSLAAGRRLAARRPALVGSSA